PRLRKQLFQLVYGRAVFRAVGEKEEHARGVFGTKDLREVTEAVQVAPLKVVHVDDACGSFSNACEDLLQPGTRAPLQFAGLDSSGGIPVLLSDGLHREK